MATKNVVTLSWHESDQLNNGGYWEVVVVAPDGDRNAEGYSTLEEAVDYIKDVADRPLRPFDWSSMLTSER